ncbi:MAG: hypothetical protein RIM99_18975 [Cyclobacteriaceae bacterium]
MKFLDRIGLAKSIEIPTSLNARAFEQQLLNFKNSKKNRFGFLYASSFIPAELTIKNGEFIISLLPRFLLPFTPIGEIRGNLTPNDSGTIEARVFSIFYMLFFMIFMSTIMGVFAISISYDPTSNFLIFWFVALLGFNLLVYFLLRYSVRRLERKFRIFINEQILSKA